MSDTVRRTEDQVVSLYLSGLTIDGVAAKLGFGLTRAGVYKILVRTGTPRRRQGPRAGARKGTSERNKKVIAAWLVMRSGNRVGERFGITSQRVYQILKAAGAGGMVLALCLAFLATPAQARETTKCTSDGNGGVSCTTRGDGESTRTRCVPDGDGGFTCKTR